MTAAVDGVSLLFSRPADVRRIAAGDHRVALVLRRYELTLAGCSARVERLGAPPTALAVARREALHACVSLERAATLIRKGITAFQNGLGTAVLGATGDPLTAGADGLRRAELDLPLP
jgi:hypothetical protein